MTTYDEARTRAAERMERALRLKTLIVEGLGMDIPPAAVSDNQPLFGRGLEMDSLDTLEIVVLVGDEFGVTMSDDDAEAFASINGMVDFIEAASS